MKSDISYKRKHSSVSNDIADILCSCSYLRKYHFLTDFSTSIFFKVIISVTPSSTPMNFYPHVNNIDIKGTVSQILKLGPI